MLLFIDVDFLASATDFWASAMDVRLNSWRMVNPSSWPCIMMTHNLDERMGSSIKLTNPCADALRKFFNGAFEAVGCSILRMSSTIFRSEVLRTIGLILKNYA